MAPRDRGSTSDHEDCMNDDSASLKSGEPWRFSLWEIHSITGFFVCPAGEGGEPAATAKGTLSKRGKAHPAQRVQRSAPLRRVSHTGRTRECARRESLGIGWPSTK